MASTIKVDKIEGSTGSTVTVPTGQTFTVTDGLAIGSLPTITVAKGGTNTTSYTAGDVLYASGATTLTKLAKGTAEQVLSMNSGETAPEWTTAAPTAGGTGQTTWATGDLLYANGSNTLTKLTKPGSTMNLQMTSAGVPSWVAPAGGAFTFIDSAAASTSASIDVDSIDSTYDVYLIQYSQIRPATDGSYSRIRMKVGGTAVTSSDYRYGATWFSSSGSYPGGTTRSDSATEIVLAYNGSSDAAAEPKSGWIWLYSPSSTSVWKNVSWQDVGMQHDGFLYSTLGAGLLETTSAVDGISFFQSSGDITSGNIRLYGLTNS